MAYALQSMLRIRGLRQDRAQTELATARAVVRQAEADRDTKHATRVRFDSQKDPRRDALFARVIGRVVSRQELDLTREAVMHIDEESMLLAEAERQAETTVTEKKAIEEVKHTAFTAAAKEKEKIEEHRRIWEEEDRKHREALADAELEEFTGRKLIADDDDTLD